MKQLLLYAICVFLVSCLNKKHDLLLHYDLYRGDSIIKRDAVQIEYKSTDSPNIRVVEIYSKLDSAHIMFKERVADTGIFRSIDGSKFQLTHAFNTNQNIISELPKYYPVFLNTWVQNVNKKSYAIGGMDSLEVIYFGEIIPAYTTTASYYSKEFGFFILFYDPRKDSYLKIERIEGEPNINAKAIIAITDKVIQDTSFFYRFLKDKLPHVPPPPLKN